MLQAGKRFNSQKDDNCIELKFHRGHGQRIAFNEAAMVAPRYL